MWSIEGIETTYAEEKISNQEKMFSDEKTSDEEFQKVKVNMIRVGAPINEDEQDEPFEPIEEQWYKFGRNGNQSELDLSEALRWIDEEETALK